MRQSEYFGSVESELLKRNLKESFAIGSEVAQKIAKEAREKVARELREKAAREARERIAKEAREKATKEASQKVQKEASQKVQKEAQQKIQTEAQQKARQELQDKARKDAQERASKNVAEKEAKDSLEKEAKDSFLKKNPKLVIGGVSAAVAAGVAYDRFTSRDGSPSDITKIYAEEDYIAIEYATELEFCANDQAEITGSNSTPSIDGTWNIVQVISNTKILIDRSSEDFEEDGDVGVITLQTDFTSQMTCVTAEATSSAIGMVGNVAKNVFKQIGDTLGLTELFKKYAWVFYAIGALILLGAIYKVYNMFKSDKVEVAMPQGFGGYPQMPQMPQMYGSPQGFGGYVMPGVPPQIPQMASKIVHSIF